MTRKMALDMRHEQAIQWVEQLRNELARRQADRRRGHGAPSDAAKVPLLAWMRELLAHHCQRPWSRMHRWLGPQLDHMMRRRASRRNVLAPRGSAKSTLGTLAFPLRAAIEGRRGYIWIVSDTADQAAMHLENIKRELVDNAQLAARFPASTGQGLLWRSDRAVLRNGVTIEAYGTLSRIRGRRRGAQRPDLIICDDLQNDGHILSARLRDKTWEWFHGALLRAGTVRTDVLVLGTALHRDAISMRLASTPGWRSRTFRAIERWPRQRTLWEMWEHLICDTSRPEAQGDARRFYDDRRDAMNEGAVLLWPEEENLYTLMAMRAECGHAAFAREKQNAPVSPDMCEWDDSYFPDSMWFETWPRRRRATVVAIDPSKGADSRRGDYSAIVVVTLGDDGTIYVEADLARRAVPRIVDDAVKVCLAHRPDLLGVEANQFQDLLRDELAAALRREDCVGVFPFPIENRTSKLVRIRRLGPYLASRAIRFREKSPSTQLLVRQLRDFPVGDHDDGPDALEMALRLLEQLTRPSNTEQISGNMYA